MDIVQVPLMILAFYLVLYIFTWSYTFLLGLIHFYLVLYIFTSSYTFLLGLLTRFYLVSFIFTTYLSAWALMQLDVLRANLFRLDILTFLHILIDQFTK